MKTENEQINILKSRISKKEMCGLYLLVGEEKFARSAAVNAFLSYYKTMPLSEFNIHVFDGKETDALTIITAAEALPVMSDEKLVVVKNSGVFKNASDYDKKVYGELFANIPEYLCMVFDEDETDGRNALLKSAKKYGLFAEFKYKTHAELVAFCKKEFDKEQISVSADVLSHLVFSCDEGMNSVLSEVNKLAAYASDSKTVTMEDVDKIVLKSLKSRVFEMIDAMTEKKADEVYAMLEEMKICRESPVKILALIGRQAMMLSKTVIYLKSGSSNIAAKLGLKPFIAQKYIAQARRLDEKQAVKMVGRCVQADYALKTGIYDEWTALSLLIADILSDNY